MALSDTHIFSPASLLAVYLSWDRDLTHELSPRVYSNYDVQKQLEVFVPSNARPGAFENEIPLVSITGFASLGDSAVCPLIQPDENYQIVGNSSLLKGKHALKIGAEMLKTRSAHIHGRGTNGAIAFQPGNSAGSGNPFADFLLGLPYQSSIVTTTDVVDIRQSRTGFY